MMDLPPGCHGAHDVEFYEKTLRDILDSGLPFDRVTFKDASGTSSPHKVYETIKMARRLLGEGIRLRLHTHETAGVSVAAYLAALEAGVTGIDLAAAPVSGGTSQPDILTLLHATKGSAYNLGDLKLEKVLRYEERFKAIMNDYFTPPEATQVNPLIPFAPMPGGALTANTQMMRDEGNLERFDEVIHAMTEVVERGGYGTSVTPVSQFYWQQAYANVMFGAWKQIAPGYGKMVLGYFGRTPVEPDPQIVELASQKLRLEPTNDNPLDIADNDEKKSIKYWQKVLLDEGIDDSEENIFIACAGDQKGVAFLKGESPLMVRKNSDTKQKPATQEVETTGSYTVTVDGKKYNVEVSENSGTMEVTPQTPPATADTKSTPVPTKPDKGGFEILSQTPGNVWKVFKAPGDSVEEGETIMVLEAMKMEIEIASPRSGTLASVDVAINDSVHDGQLLATLV